MKPYPRFGTEWGVCGMCGFNYPKHQLRLTRSDGWRCLPHNVWKSYGCDDGDTDRDDIYYVSPPGEGSRRTNAPLPEEATEGVTFVNSSDQTVYRFFDHSDPSQRYDLTFPSSGSLTFVGTTDFPKGIGGWILPSGNTFYFQGGAFQWKPGTTGLIGLLWRPSHIDLDVVGDSLIYTP